MKSAALLTASLLLSTQAQEIEWGTEKLHLQAGLSVDEVVNKESSYYKATLFIINKSNQKVKIMQPLFRGYYTVEYKGFEYDKYLFSIRNGKLKKKKRAEKDLIPIAAGDTLKIPITEGLSFHRVIDENNSVSFTPGAGTYYVKISLNLNKNGTQATTLETGWAPITQPKEIAEKIYPLRK